MEESPALLHAGDVTHCRMIPLKPVAVETFADCAALGRFCIRELGSLFAVGLVMEVDSLPVEIVRQ